MANQKEGVEEKSRRVYLPTADVFLLNPFAAYILTGNNIPQEDLENLHLRALARLEKPVDLQPNDLYIHEIVEKDLRNYRNSKNPAISFNARLAEIVLERLKRAEGGLAQLDTREAMLDIDAVYSTLKNGANVYFVRYNDAAFNGQLPFQPDNTDRLVHFVKTLESQMNRRRFNTTARSILPDADYDNVDIDRDKGRIIDDAFECKKSVDNPIEVILVSQDPSARGRALSNLCCAQELRYENINEPAQLPTGISIHDLKKADILKNPQQKYTAKMLQEYFHTRIYSNQIIAIEDEKGDLQQRIAKLQSDSKFLLRPFQYISLLDLRKKINENIKDSLKSKKEADDCKIYAYFDESLAPKQKQAPYLELLFDDEIQLVSANGPSTGKKLFAFLAGLMGVSLGKYDKLRYVRLQTDVLENAGNYLTSCDDALREIFGYYRTKSSEKTKIEQEIERIKKIPLIECELLSGSDDFVWKREFVIVDKAQTFSRSQMKMLLRRSGDATKLVVLGHLGQTSVQQDELGHIITERNSGLAHLIEKLSGESNYGHITFGNTENLAPSKTARLAEKI